MPDVRAPVMDLVFGRRPRRTLYAGVEHTAFEGGREWPGNRSRANQRGVVDRLQAIQREYGDTRYPENERLGALDAVPDYQRNDT